VSKITDDPRLSDLIEFLVNDAVDSGGLFAEMTQFTEGPSSKVSLPNAMAF